ncbi:hypothetical protein HK105_206643 [Polyrhizophydium stewartii]|uniref:Uncharacterized protein n=1 Tax=Polyrhizophydium stewartii TaxID=2732419 RepID=A0ABR4N342_9FUNG
MSDTPSTAASASEPEQQAQQQQEQEQEQPARMPLPKKSGNPLLGRFNKASAGVTSPTDNMMSPATQKVEAKRGRLLNNIKPTSLASRFAKAAEPESGSSASGSSSTDL